jgi:hypothetical protein
MFNTQARWDRPLPQEDVLPGEAVDVVMSYRADFTRYGSS